MALSSSSSSSCSSASSASRSAYMQYREPAGRGSTRSWRSRSASDSRSRSTTSTASSTCRSSLFSKGKKHGVELVISGDARRRTDAHVRLLVLRRDVGFAAATAAARTTASRARIVDDPGRVPAAAARAREFPDPARRSPRSPRRRVRVRRLQPALPGEVRRPEVRLLAARREDDAVAARRRRRSTASRSTGRGCCSRCRSSIRRGWLDLGSWLEQFHRQIPAVVYSTYPPR